jgi:hypothetical protein
MVTLAPVLLRFLTADGGRLRWTRRGEVSLSCDRPEPLSFHELAGPLAYAHLIRLIEAIRAYRAALEFGQHALAPQLVADLGSELAELVRKSLRRRGRTR